MATVNALGPGSYPLSAAQTGNTSSDVLDRGVHRGPVAVVITTTVGATPTTKIDLEVSADAAAWYNGAYSLPATPETVAVAQITETNATTVTYEMRPGHAWRYLRVRLSSNTNVTASVAALL